MPISAAAGTNLIANSQDHHARPCHLLEVEWSNGVWTDESASLIEADGSMSLTSPESGLSGGNEGIASSCRIALNNTNIANDLDGKFSYFNTNSPLYQYIGNGKFGGKGVRLSLGYYQGNNKETLRQFTGNIYDYADLYPDMRVEWQCQDSAQKIMHQRVRTTLYTNNRADQLLNALATLVNISSVSLDKGLFIFPYWWSDSESSWEEMVKIAQADGGRVFFNKSGTLCYHNMHHFIFPSVQTVQHTFTVSNWKSIRPQSNPLDLWDGVICEYAPLEESYSQVIYQAAGEPHSIPPNGGVKTFSATFSRPATTIVSPVGGSVPVSNGIQTSTDNRDYVIVTAGGDDITANCTLNMTTYAQRAEITITNNHTTATGYLVKFQLRGTPLSGQPSSEVQYNSSRSPVSFPRIKEIRGNELIQSLAQADTIALFLRDRLETPRIIYTIDAPFAAPYLDLADRVQIVAAVPGNASFWTRTGFIVGINWRYSASSGYTAQYAVMDDNNLYPHANPFIVGTSKYGGSGVSGNGQLVY